MYHRERDDRDRMSRLLDRVQVNALEDLLLEMIRLGGNARLLAQGIEFTLEPSRGSLEEATRLTEKIREAGLDQAADSFIRFQRMM